MNLIEFIKSKVELTKEESESIDKAFKTERHLKGAILLQPESMNQKVIFVEKGLMRTFYIHNDKDITHFFFDENSFSAPIESIFYNKPDRFGRQALEETVLRTIHFRDWSKLCTENRQLKELAFLMAIDVCRLFADRIFSLQFQTAQERYKALIDNYPSILLRAPLGHIASYLGITQQTLSVIRSVK